MERLTVASAAMLSLDREAAEDLAEATLDDLKAGLPFAPFLSVRDEARSWAAVASRRELRAYLGAIWGQMPKGEQVGFLRAARQTRSAAA